MRPMLQSCSKILQVKLLCTRLVIGTSFLLLDCLLHCNFETPGEKKVSGLLYKPEDETIVNIYYSLWPSSFCPSPVFGSTFHLMNFSF